MPAWKLINSQTKSINNSSRDLRSKFDPAPRCKDLRQISKNGHTNVLRYMTSGYSRTIRAVIAAVLVVTELSVDNQLILGTMVALGILTFACIAFVFCCCSVLSMQDFI